ncbi:chromosome partitioning protein ParA [Listeria monocytogenes]|nr:chromosome partitioning protein ParA [Listeria monocytogenes]
MFTNDEYISEYEKIKHVLEDGKCRVIINANQKGGVGKTTNTTMEAVVLAHIFNKRILVIDEDMQGNETSFMSKTYDVVEFPKSLMKAIEDGDLKSAIVRLDDNIDIIPGSYDMRKMVNFLIGKFKNEVDQTFYLSSLIDDIRDDYDFIFIDVPPSTDLKVDNAVVAADYLVVVQETQQFALEGSNTFISTYLNTLVDDFGSKFKTEIVGILPVLLQKKRKLHEKILETTKEKFGRENVFSTTINNHARLELYGKFGVQFEDHWDRTMFALYTDIVQEILERIQLIEEGSDLNDYRYSPKFYNAQTGKVTPLGKEIIIHGKINRQKR